MIDIDAEHLITIRDVPMSLPTRHNGKAIHISAVYRWLHRGVRGVRLEAVTIGGTTYTSAEAIQRFAEQLSRARSPASAPQAASMASPAQRRRQIEQATRRVTAVIGEMAPNPRHDRMHRHHTS